MNLTKQKYKEIQEVAAVLMNVYSYKLVVEFLNREYFIKESSLKKIFVMDLRNVRLENPSLTYKTVMLFKHKNKLGIFNKATAVQLSLFW